MSCFEPYSETKLAHQEPFQAISQWQQFNELDDDEAIAWEADMIYTDMKRQGFTYAEIRQQVRIYAHDPDRYLYAARLGVVPYQLR